MFQRKLYVNYVFCVVYCLLCIIVLCCANNQMQIFSKKVNFFFIKTKIYYFFFEWCFFSTSACSVWLMWPSHWWSHCVFLAVLEPLRRHSAGWIEPSFCRSLALMGMSCNKPYKFYLPTDFHNFCCKKFSNQQAIITHTKKINKMFNKTIWILTFVS